MIMAMILLWFAQVQGTLHGGAKVQTPVALPPPAGLTLVGSCPMGSVGSPFSCSLSAIGGTPPYTFTEVSRQVRPRVQIRMPLGLTLASNGVISGTPTQVGTTQVTVQVTDSVSATAMGTVSIVVFELSHTAQLPQVWANPHEADLPNPCDTAHNCYVKRIPGDFACSLSGLQASMDQWAATAPNVWWHVVINDSLSAAPGRCIITSTTSSGWKWRAKSTGFPTAFIVYESEHPNPAGRTVCNHVVGMPLDGPSRRNPGCDTTPGYDDLEHMWKFTTTGGGGYGGAFVDAYNQVDSAGNGASHIVVKDVELEVLGSGIPIYLFTCNANTGICPVQPPTRQSFVSHVGFERSYMHGDWIVPANGAISSPSGGSETAALVTMSCGLCWFTWNYVDRMSRGWDNEGKIFGLTNSLPGVKIAHNFLEGGEIGSMTGGNNGTTLSAASSDVEIRANIWTRDPAWIASRGGGGGIPVAYWDCRASIKNTFEMKEGIRYLLNGNVFENSIACSQQGQDATITVRACSGGVNCNNFTAEIRDITFTNNVVRTTENGVQISSRSVGQGSGQTVSMPIRRLNIVNNLFYNIRLGVGNSGYPKNVYMSGGDTSINWTSCTGSRDSAGAVSTITCAESNSPPWNSRTLISVGDPITMRWCQPDTFNTPVGVGPPALNGTDGLQPNGRTVVYANTGPPNEQVVSGCMLWSTQGAPFESTYIHNTVVWTGGNVTWPQVVGRVAPAGQPAGFNCVFARGNIYQDDVMAASPTTTWSLMASCGQAGITAQNIGFDTSTLTFGHLLFLGNKASQVAAYPASEAGTLWSPAQSGVVCAGATADSACIGFNGYMNGAAFMSDPASQGHDPLVFFALAPSSLYHAGNARQASDGTDMGANMNKIRNAMSETQYSGCSPGACGPTGPFPD